MNWIETILSCGAILACFYGTFFYFAHVCPGVQAHTTFTKLFAFPFVMHQYWIAHQGDSQALRPFRIVIACEVCTVVFVVMAMFATRLT